MLLDCLSYKILLHNGASQLHGNQLELVFRSFQGTLLGGNQNTCIKALIVIVGDCNMPQVFYGLDSTEVVMSCDEQTSVRVGLPCKS